MGAKYYAPSDDRVGQASVEECGLGGERRIFDVLMKYYMLMKE